MVNIKEIVLQLTLEEKAGICSGADFWHTKAVDRLGIPASMVSDGPHGLRKQDMEADHLGLNDSIKAVCFPAGCGTAASFNRALIEKMGETLGEECRAEGVGVLLGPAVNIKRSPLCGRNFEYYSEDPLLTTEMAGALVKGVQSKNVGTSIKHFLANNQEHRRMTSSSEIDERTLREIYLAAFEGAVKKQKPWTIMCSYNKINGTYAAENKTYLTDVLRGEWGFDGYVMSDWGATNRRVEDLIAGLDLEMPGSGGVNDKLIVEAVINGTLEEAVLDQAVERILNIVYKCKAGKDTNANFDREKDHEKALEVAHETVVLLKNDNILPLKSDDNIAFVGKYAKTPRFQGGGSSHINSFKVASALEAVSGLKHITYAEGFRDDVDEVDTELEKEAVCAAQKAKVAVVFVGLPDSFESEGFDRRHMRLPDCQNHLIQEILAVQPNTVVVLHNGSPVEMLWVQDVKGIIEAYLSGQVVGQAVVDILFGKVNPSAKLPETFPEKLEDNPSYLYYQGERDCVEYKEGVFVGYRYYDTKKMNVLFPFGHGLSYTTFSYTNLRFDADIMEDSLKVMVDVMNTGDREGKEVVQLYVSAKNSKVIRPVQELRAFDKVRLAPGETKTVTFTLDKRAFSYWEVKVHDWYAENGTYEIRVGSSSRDIRVMKEIKVVSSKALPFEYTLDTCFLDVLENPEAVEIVAPLKDILNSIFGLGDSEEEDTSSKVASKEMMMAMIRYMPLRGIVSFGGGHIKMDDILKIVDKLNMLNEA